MKLVVGLGNPGKKYDNTRHNVGFEIIEMLAQRHAAEGGKTKFEGLLRECLIGGERVLLLMPSTFMNLSGRSVRQAIDFYKIPKEELLVVCDDFHLPAGKIRMRAKGSDGGQNGLADVIRQLGTNELSRLRFGIGPVPDNWNTADFVLGKFSNHERKQIDDALIRSANAVDKWVALGIKDAMNEFNADPKTE